MYNILRETYMIVKNNSYKQKKYNKTAILR